MESSGEAGRINISAKTYELVKDYFDCEYRGKVSAKNEGELDMYFLYGLNQKYSEDEFGINPNRDFISELELIGLVEKFI